MCVRVPPFGWCLSGGNSVSKSDETRFLFFSTEEKGICFRFCHSTCKGGRVVFIIARPASKARSSTVGCLKTIRFHERRGERERAHANPFPQHLPVFFFCSKAGLRGTLVGIGVPRRRHGGYCEGTCAPLRDLGTGAATTTV